MGRYGKRTDSNHKEIRDALKKFVGYIVKDTSSIHDGFLDLFCGYNGHFFMIEIKDGTKNNSQKKLTESEEKTFSKWKGYPLCIVESLNGLYNMDLDIQKNGIRSISGNVYK